jgi:hypothetical protein
MKVQIKGKECIVTRESSDRRFTRGSWSDAESSFLYNVKKELIKQGYDVIKKRMWHDGHLTDDTHQYIRTRKPSGNPLKDIYVVNDSYAVYDAGERFNIDGVVSLSVYTGVFEAPND